MLKLEEPENVLGPHFDAKAFDLLLGSPKGAAYPICTFYIQVAKQASHRASQEI